MARPATRSTNSFNVLSVDETADTQYENLGSETNIEVRSSRSTNSLANPDWVNMEFTDIGKSVFLNYPLTKDRKDLKVSSVRTALQLNDMGLLSNLSISRGGLLNNELRAKVWPLFLGIKDINDESLLFDHETLPPHPDESQVQLDVNRSFSNYPKKHDHVKELRQSLSLLITKILRKHPNLSYYQGYHDIAQLVLLVFNNNLTQSYIFLDKLTLVHLRDYMMPTINSSICHLNLILLILYKKDYNFFKILNNLKPFYALSSIITLFTHDVADYEEICCVFDFLLSNGNSVIFNSIYLYTEILLLNKNQILNSIFENIYNKINSTTESVMSESGTLADSMLSNKTDISEGSSETIRSSSPEIMSQEPSLGNSSIAESQYQKTSLLSNSDFIGYDDRDIELINFDYLHNILANLVSDYTRKSCKNDNSNLFEAFLKTTELVKNCPIFDEVQNIDNVGSFGKNNSLTVQLSKYSVLKNTSSPCTCLGDPLELLEFQHKEVIEQQKREKEEQLKQFEELMRQRKLKKDLARKPPTSYPFLYNMRISRFFKHHKLIKISVVIGIISLFINIYLNDYRSSRIFNQLLGDLSHFGRHFHAGINTLISDNGVLVNGFHHSWGFEGLVESFNEFSRKLFS